MLATGIARMLFMYSPAGIEGMFAEIGSPGSRGTQAPPLSASDVEALARVAGKCAFRSWPIEPRGRVETAATQPTRRHDRKVSLNHPTTGISALTGLDLEHRRHDLRGVHIE